MTVQSSRAVIGAVDKVAGNYRLHPGAYIITHARYPESRARGALGDIIYSHQASDKRKKNTDRKSEKHHRDYINPAVTSRHEHEERKARNVK